MTQFGLKLLALFCMLCDHVAKVVLSTGVLIPLIGVEADLALRTAMVVVGRMGFPIFAWFVAEGCRKTHNMPKYILRLGIFAVLSEIPFQLCFDGAWSGGLSLACHNVLFTMLLAAGAVWLTELLKKTRMPDFVRILAPAVIAVSLGWFLHTDYNAWGVALILMLYYFPEERQQLMVLAAWSSMFQLIWHGWNGHSLNWLSGDSWYRQILYWMGELFSVLFLATYNGERGKKCKWLFYWFYPLHLTLLFLLRLWISAY